MINNNTYYDDILIKFLRYIRGEFATLRIAVNSRFMTQFTATGLVANFPGRFVFLILFAILV